MNGGRAGSLALINDRLAAFDSRRYDVRPFVPFIVIREMPRYVEGGVLTGQSMLRSEILRKMCGTWEAKNEEGGGRERDSYEPGVVFWRELRFVWIRPDLQEVDLFRTVTFLAVSDASAGTRHLDVTTFHHFSVVHRIAAKRGPMIVSRHARGV